jgi:hypothetical protein
VAFASIESINSYLPDGSNQDGPAISADNINTANIAFSVERVIRGYLSRVISVGTMASWVDPDSTPEIIQECAAMLIAAQLYFDQVAASSLDIDLRHVSQLLYDRAMAILNGIIEGEIIIVDIPVESVASMNLENFFPIDDTDRAFTLSQQF